MKIRFALRRAVSALAAAIALAVAAPPALAAANTYCVHEGALSYFGIDEGANLQQALDAAKANAGDDTGASSQVRVWRRPLAAGRHQLLLTATDGAGNRSMTYRAAFTVLAARHPRPHRR